jgi:hypothetical protein
VVGTLRFEGFPDPSGGVGLEAGDAGEGGMKPGLREAAGVRIARLVGHQTETVYRHQIQPVIEDAASAINFIFPADQRDQDDDDDGGGRGAGPGMT